MKKLRRLLWAGAGLWIFVAPRAVFATGEAGTLGQAVGQRPATPMPGYGTSCKLVTISSGPIEISSNTVDLGTSPRFINLTLINLSATATLFASDNVAVSSISGNGNYGVPIAPSPAGVMPNWFAWPLGAAQRWYALNDSAGNVNALVCKTD